MTSDTINIQSDNFSVDKTGKVTAKSGIVGGYSLTENSFYSEIYPLKDYTQDDLQKILDYLNGTIELTQEEKKLYDVNGDGVINSMDMYLIVRLINSNITTQQRGTIHINKRDPINTIVFKDGYDNIMTRIGILGIETGRIKTKELEADNLVEDITDKFEFTGSATGKVYKIGKVVFMQIYMLALETAGWGTVATIPSDLYPVEIFDGGTPISRNTVLGIW